MPPFATDDKRLSSMNAQPSRGAAVPQENRQESALPAPSLEERLNRLKRLRENGLITEEEYRDKRKQLLEKP